MYINIYLYRYIYIYIYIHAYTYTQTHVTLRTARSDGIKLVCTFVPSSIYIYIRVYVYTYVYIDMYVYIYRRLRAKIVRLAFRVGTPSEIFFQLFQLRSYNYSNYLTIIYIYFSKNNGFS